MIKDPSLWIPHPSRGWLRSFCSLCWHVALRFYLVIYEARSQVRPRIPEVLTLLWGFASAYVSKCRNITRCRRNMVDSAFKSWWSILSDPNKIFVIRTHPEELHVLKYISSLHICTDFSQQWGQQMLAKCYPTSQGCSYDFQRLKVWPLGVPKPYRTSSYDALSPLSRSTLFVICWILWKICGIKHNHKKCWPRQRR